ncbi:MAG TPA: hypothetical protein VF203_13695 [Burkholderiales bacterium]
MTTLSRGNQLRAAAAAPAVAIGYALIALLVTRVGCQPPFVDTEVFGVPATAFLLLALTVSALILIMFAALNAWRTLRVLRRRRRAFDARARAIAVLGIALAALALAATAWIGVTLLQTPCT